MIHKFDQQLPFVVLPLYSFSLYIKKNIHVVYLILTAFLTFNQDIYIF